MPSHRQPAPVAPAGAQNGHTTNRPHNKPARTPLTPQPAGMVSCRRPLSLSRSLCLSFSLSSCLCLSLSPLSSLSFSWGRSHSCFHPHLCSRLREHQSHVLPSPSLSLSSFFSLSLAQGLITSRPLEDTIGTPTCWRGVLTSLALSLVGCQAPLGLPSAGCTITWSKAHSWAVKRHLGCQVPAEPRTKRRSLGERRPRGGATKTAALGGGRRRRAFRPLPERRPPLSHLALEGLCRERHELLQGCLRGVFLTRAQ